jgi:hypothetical protein
MTGFDSKRRIALDRLDDDDIQIYAQPEGKIMTKDDALTLEALKYAASMGYPSSMLKDMFAPFTLKEALAQPEQEPVEDVVAYHSDGTRTVRIAPKRPWVGLTDEEISQLWISTSPYFNEDDFARAVEAKLKELNT